MWIVCYAVYLYLSGHCFRKASKALTIFIGKIHQFIWRRVHRFRSLSKAFYVGRAGTAVIDVRSINVKGLEAWL